MATEDSRPNTGDTAAKTPEHLHIESQVSTRLPQSPIYSFLLSNVHILSASKGHVIARLPLTSAHMNSGGSLHGSVSATLVDWMGGMAVAAYDLRSRTGVSLDIHVTYLAAAREGEELEIEGVAEKVGGSVAFTKVGIFKVAEGGGRGVMVASGTHTKFVKGTEPR